MKTSETMGEIAKALANFQATCPPLKKTQTAVGKKFSYKFIDLADVLATIKQPLIENGLAIYQTPVNEPGGRVGVITLILHASGEFIESAPFTVPGGDNAQDAGGAVTYARRYSLTSALGIAAFEEDTDGATGYPPQQSHQQERRQQSNSRPPQAHQQNQQQRPPQQPQGEPLISPNQLKAIKATINQLATQNGADSTEIYTFAANAIGAGGKSSKQLNRKEASLMIDYLRSRQSAN